MNLKDLSPQQMLHITAAWLDPERDRPHLQKLARVAPLLPDVEQAHEGVRKTHGKEKKNTTALADIQAQQLGLDKLHDRKARGSWNVLTGFADLADDPEDAAFYLELRNSIFTNGLKFITGSYASEAGEAQLARDRLTPERKAALKALPTPSGSLLKAMQAWIHAGEKLGELETARAKLEAEAEGTPQEGTPQGSQLRARNRWIRVVRCVLQMLELEDVDAETERHLLAPLHRALEKADHRPPGAEDAPEDALDPAADGASPALG